MRAIRHNGKFVATPWEIRFWANVEKTGTCWIWKGNAFQSTGYGKIVIEKKHLLTHRLAYELLIGPIPEGKEIDHLCRIRLCCNPLHLEAVTHRENVVRGNSAASRNAKKTHCVHGHLLAGDNLIKSGKRKFRKCRTCNQEKCKLYQRQNRGVSAEAR